MLRYLPVRKVHARQVLDSRGNPTVEAEVTVGEGIVGINGYTGRAMVPSGASTGKFEAVELRDGNREEYLGQSVKKAVENINTRLADAIIGENALNQAWIDHLLIETDGRDGACGVFSDPRKCQNFRHCTGKTGRSESGHGWIHGYLLGRRIL